MVETKSIRIENWGSFFLQKLQVFFSKTDYCDLTLQFEGNVQLKVHRLVMNACTEYFTYLEQACPALEENTIMMPPELQADVIVPIVNFMYTGMLEYNPVLFERLYKATQQMKISVLTQMMEAQLHKPALKRNKPLHHVQHNNTEAISSKSAMPSSSSNSEFPGALPGRKLPIWKRRQAPTSNPSPHPVSATFSESKWASHPPPDPLAIDNTAKPTRFEWPEEDLPPINLMDTTFEDISYNSKPLLTKEEEQKASTSFANKKIKTNPDDLEEEEGKPRTPGMLFVEESQLSNSDEPQKRKAETQVKSSPKRVKISENATETTISIKSSSSATDLDHTKIVSEILKKYPQLVKKNKNIRLKIMSKSPSKEEEVEKTRSYVGKNIKAKNQAAPPAKSNIEIRAEQAALKARASKANTSEDGPWTCLKCMGVEKDPPEFVLYYLYRKHMVDAHSESFDPKLCKYCGKRCETNLLMMYHLYTKHGLKPPVSYNFPKCDRCPYIAYSESKILKHKGQHKKEEVRCSICKLTFKNSGCLNYHTQITGHSGKFKQSHTTDCQFCPKKLTNPVNLFSHLKSQHYRDAKTNGVVSLDETMDVESPEILEDPEIVENGNADDSPTHKDKVKIISNVKVPVKQEPESSIQVNADDAEGLSGNLQTSLGLVDIVVLDDNQQQYILQQEDNESGDTEYILPTIQNSDGTFNTQVITTQNNTVIPQGVLQTGSATDISSTDELVMVLTDHDYQDDQNHHQNDNSNIVVLYSHPVDGQQGQFITSQGNLLVNSQTGMLEIRNGGATITTTTASQVLLNDHDSPAESIEMIQREIDRHATSEPKPVMMFGGDVKPDVQEHPEKILGVPEQEPEVEKRSENIEDTVQEMEEHLVDAEQQLEIIQEHLGKVQEDVAQQEIQSNPQEDVEVVPEESVQPDSQENVEEPQIQEEEEERLQQTEEQREEDTVDSTGDCFREEPMEVEDIAGPSGEIKENEQQQQQQPPDSMQNEEQQTEDERSQDQTEEPVIEQEPTAEENNPEEESPGEDVPPEAKSDEKDAENTEHPAETLATEKSTEEENSKEPIIEEEPMEVDGNNKETLSETVNEEEELVLNSSSELIMAAEPGEQEQNQQQEEEESPELEKSTEEIQESVDEVDNSEPNTSLEETEEHHDESVQEETQEEVKVQQIVKKSTINRTILQDWGEEDTDSQHSDKQKDDVHQERVNKLVDDWEEEEEDDKSRDE